MRNIVKLLMSIFIMCCMVFCLASFSLQEVAAHTIPEYVKVGLRYGDNASEKCVLSSKTGFKLGLITDVGFEETLSLNEHEEIFINIEDGQLILKDSEGEIISPNICANTCIRAASYEEDGLITFETNRYRGGFMFLTDKNFKIKVINYLTLDEYLYGVLHMEMSQGHPIEALKAQAVAARSFTIQSIGRHAADGFDLCPSTHCQVYGGYKAEYPSTCRAVDETTGLLVWNKGKPVPTFYYKNSGGHTQNVGDVWSQSLAYLIGKPDPYSPNYPWTATITFDVLKEKLSNAGYSTGAIQNVRILEHNSSGAVSKILIEGNMGTAILEKDKIRGVLGATVLKSTHFDIESDKIEYEEPTTEIDIKLSNGKKKTDAKNITYVLSAGNKIKDVKTEELYYSNGNQTNKVKLITKVEDNENKKGKVIVTGKGYGHGVGMAQDGAIEMAKKGYTFREILNFYFTDIEVR